MSCHVRTRQPHRAAPAARAATFVGLLTPGIPAWATIALVALLGASVSVPYYVSGALHWCSAVAGHGTTTRCCTRLLCTLHYAACCPNVANAANSVHRCRCPPSTSVAAAASPPCWREVSRVAASVAHAHLSGRLGPLPTAAARVTGAMPLDIAALTHGHATAADRRCCAAAATETGAFGAAMLFDLAVGRMLSPGGGGWPAVIKVCSSSGVEHRGLLSLAQHWLLVQC